MKRQNNFLFSRLLHNFNFLFLIICALFLIGTVFGVLAASDFEDSAEKYIPDMTLVSPENLFEIKSLIFNFIFIFLCGISLGGILILPIYVLFKGFSQSLFVVLIFKSFERFNFVDIPSFLIFIFLLFTFFNIFYLFFSFKSSLMFFNCVFKKSYNNVYIFSFFKETFIYFLLILIFYFFI